MSTNKWTRNDKIGLAGVVVALVACVAAMLVPEIRKFVGLEASPVSPSIAEASGLTNANSSEGQNLNTNRHSEPKPLSINPPVNINSNTLPLPKPESPNDRSEQSDGESPIAKKDAEGFTFELRSCRTSGSDIVVSLMITNHKEERGLWLFDDTSITDYNGEVHKVNDKRFGGSEVDTKAKTDVPVRATLTFRGIAKTVRQVRLLDLHFQHVRESVHNFHVLFEKFPVSD